MEGINPIYMPSSLTNKRRIKERKKKQRKEKKIGEEKKETAFQ